MALYIADTMKKNLASLVDTLLPASDDGVMPSASELDFIGYLNDFAPDFMPTLMDILENFDAAFAAKDLEDRCTEVQTFSEEQVESFRALLSQVYGCYYQEDRVLEDIGLGKGPPFPRGSTVEPGDLSLLDPVMENSKTWRR